MKKLDYYLHAVKTGLYLERAWLATVYAIMPTDITSDYFILKDNKLTAKITIDNEQQEVNIEDFKIGFPLFDKDEKVKILNNSIGFIEGDIETTYGLLIVNCLMFWYPYQGQVKYQNMKMGPSYINKIAYDLLNENKVDITAHLRFENASSMITCLTQMGVPSASRKSITPNPEIPKLKKRLLEANKDRLNDAAVVAEIQDEIIAADKEYLKGDTSNGFYISGKNYSVHRLKTEGMYGAEPDFYDESKISVMETSLSEGWNKDNLPMLINNLRGGSYARGKETALGGESTKVTSRIFQNYRIDVDDCATILGVPVRINSININSFIGRYLVGATKPLTMVDLKGHLATGKLLSMRSPAYCKTNETSYCKKCFGDAVALGGLGLNSQAIIATSTFMGISMAAMHSKELAVRRYEFKDRIA